MNEPWFIAVPLVGLIVALATHIFIMARWSGKVDANLAQIMAQPGQWTTDLNAVAAAFRADVLAAKAEIKIRQDFLEAEIKLLRESRHDADGKIQLHEGLLREIARRLDIYKERT